MLYICNDTFYVKLKEIFGLKLEDYFLRSYDFIIVIVLETFQEIDYREKR